HAAAPQKIGGNTSSRQVIPPPTPAITLQRPNRPCWRAIWTAITAHMGKIDALVQEAIMAPNLISPALSAYQRATSAGGSPAAGGGSMCMRKISDRPKMVTIPSAHHTAAI